jgi:broad specificity phosphatase PhoE
MYWLPQRLPRTIIYLRHPQCLHNVQNDQALRDGIPNIQSPLTEVGQKQRVLTTEYVQEKFPHIDVVFSSKYWRTRAFPLSLGFQESFIPHEMLNERHMGIWHYVPHEVVLKHFPKEDEKLKEAGYFKYKAPRGGESGKDVEKRQHHFLSDLQGISVRSVLISGHGTSGVLFRKVLQGCSSRALEQWGQLKNASVSVYERVGNEYECTLWNEVPWEGKIEDVQKGVEA